MAAKLIIVGNLGADPEMRYTATGTPVANANVATNRQWKNDAGETIKETTWWRVSFWGKSAETVIQYFTKGKPIYVEGRLKAEPDVWKSKNGEYRTSYEVTCERWEFVSGGNGGNGNSEAPEYAGEESTLADDPKDIPF
jgi:single-strand DNA-binding protein